MRLIALFCFFLFSISLSAQQGLSGNYGAKSLSMGRITSTLGGADAIHGNPAALDFSSSLIVHLSAEHRFLQSSLNFTSAGLSKSLNKHSAISLSFSNFGIDEYKEIVANAAYARKLMDKLQIGAAFNYYQFKINEYGSKSAFNIKLGLFSNISKELDLAFQVLNLFRIELTEDYDIPTQLNLGFKYSPSDKASIHLEIEKKIDFEEQIKAGLEYQFIENFSLRAGFRTNPSSASFGLSIKVYDSFLIDLGFDTHPYLDISPGMSLIYYK